MCFQLSGDWLRGALIALLTLFLASPAAAEKGKLLQRLTPAVMAAVYPAGADRLGPEEGSPPAIAVYKGDKVVAYIFSTLDIIAAPGYSSTPFDVIGGIDLTGHITGAKAVFHAEPHILHDPVRERELDTFLGRQAGRALRGGTDPLPPDYVADSTVSARAMRTALLATAGLVLRARLSRVASGAVASAVPAADPDAFKMKSVDEMLADGSLVKRRVTSADVAKGLAEKGVANAKLDWPLGKDDDLYIEFVTGLATPTAIGGNLVGVVTLEEYKSQLPPGTQAIYVAANGPYNFFGTKYVEASEGNRFDRLRVVQDGKTFTFRQADYTYAVPVAGQELAGLFALRPNSGFDPSKPWRVEILVNGAGAAPVSVPFGVDYKLPDLTKTAAASTAAPAASTETRRLR
jgi:transcriptional regulator of nitric oxide reductase